MSHRRSMSTIGRNRPDSAAERRTPDAAVEEQAEGEDEIPWGPAHPCFPHPNPHVPLSSPLYESTRIIRIKRDWMIAGDEAPAFSNLYPEILDPSVPEDKFRALIAKLNTTLVATFTPSTARNWFDATMGLLTGWLWDDAGLTGIKRSLANLERWIEGWNRDVGAAEGVSIIPLRRTAYLCLDIQIPDPQVSLETEFGTSTRDSGVRAPSRSTRASGSAVGRQNHAALSDDVEYGAYPVVPPIPDRYLEEKQGKELTRKDQGSGVNGAVNGIR